MSNKKLIPEQVRKIKDAYWVQMNLLNGHDELDDAIDNYVSFLESQLEAKKPSRKTRIAELEAAYSKLLDQAESMSVMMQCPWKEGSHAQVAWRKEQDDIFNEFWDDDEVNAREAFKEKT
jgi:hypothetical protein